MVILHSSVGNINAKFGEVCRNARAALWLRLRRRGHIGLRFLLAQIRTAATAAAAGLSTVQRSLSSLMPDACRAGRDRRAVVAAAERGECSHFRLNLVHDRADQVPQIAGDLDHDRRLHLGDALNTQGA